MSDPFLLPAGNVQIAFSGGRTSGMMLYRILQANEGLPDRARVVFTNTGREHSATLDFVRDCSTHWSIPITWIEYRGGINGERWTEVSCETASRGGEPFEALIRRKKYLPNQMTRFCTSELKVRPARDFCRSIGWETWTSALGIRADEQRRLKPENREKWDNWYPMAEAGLGKADVSMFWAGRNFDLRLPNIGGKTPHGNCVGCFLKSERFLARLVLDDPDEHEWWERMEAVAGDLTSNPSGAQWSSRVSRRQLRDFMERQGEMALSTDGALCQAEDGECFGCEPISTQSKNGGS